MMATKVKALPSLCTADRQQWLSALDSILKLAEADHKSGQLYRRTGTGLRLEIGLMRVSHRRLLTTVYNQFRDELQNQASGREPPEKRAGHGAHSGPR